MSRPRKPKEFINYPVSYMEAIENGFVRSVCQNVVDGDTGDFLLDLGWHQYAYVPIRFKDVYTPEIDGTSGTEKELADEAKEFTTQSLLDKPVLLKSYKQKRSFDRFIADLYFQLEEEELEIQTITIGETKWSLFQDLLRAEGLSQS